MYDGPATRTAAEISDLTNYRMIMIDRKFGWNGVTQVPSGTNPANAVGKYYVVDAVTGLPAPAWVAPGLPASRCFRRMVYVAAGSQELRQLVHLLP